MHCFYVFGREMNRRQTYEQANKIYDKAMKLEQEFGEYFTGKIQESVRSRVCGIGQASSGRLKQSENCLGSFPVTEHRPFSSTQVSCQPPVSQVLAQATPRHCSCSCFVFLLCEIACSFDSFPPCFSS